MRYLFWRVSCVNLYLVRLHTSKAKIIYVGPPPLPQRNMACMNFIIFTEIRSITRESPISGEPSFECYKRVNDQVRNAR